MFLKFKGKREVVIVLFLIILKFCGIDILDVIDEIFCLLMYI